MSQTFNDRRALQLVAPRTLGEAGIEGPIDEGDDYPSGPGLLAMIAAAMLGVVALGAFLVLVLSAPHWGPFVDSPPPAQVQVQP